jgi:hypothetical protein
LASAGTETSIVIIASVAVSAKLRVFNICTLLFPDWQGWFVHIRVFGAAKRFHSSRDTFGLTKTSRVFQEYTRRVSVRIEYNAQIDSPEMNLVAILLLGL